MIVIYLYVCSIYDDDDDDDDDDEATRESPETRGRGLCRYLGFQCHSVQNQRSKRTQTTEKRLKERECRERERDRRRRIKRE